MYKWEHDEGHDCTYTSLLTKKLTLNDNYKLCTLSELSDFDINWTLNLNNYLLIPCLDSKRAYGSRKNLLQIWGSKKSIKNAKKKVKHQHTQQISCMLKKKKKKKEKCAGVTRSKTNESEKLVSKPIVLKRPLG